MLLLIKKHTDRFTEQTKTKSQETLEFKLNKQVETFSFNPPINLAGEGKFLLAVTSFEATKSASNISIENSTFSIKITGYWVPKINGEIVNKLYKFLKLRSENDTELPIKEFEKEVVCLKF